MITSRLLTIGCLCILLISVAIPFWFGRTGSPPSKLNNVKLYEHILEEFKHKKFSLFTYNHTDVEIYQRKQLGSLFKTVLPIRRTAIDSGTNAPYVIDPRLIDVFPPLSRGDWEVVMRKIEEVEGQYEFSLIIPLLGPSGVGKTRTLLKLMDLKYTIWFSAQETSAPLVERDLNYLNMAADITRIFEDVDISNIYQWHANTFLMAKKRIKLEYLARRLYLNLLFKSWPSLTPTQFRDVQLNGGQHDIRDIVEHLKGLYLSDENIERLIILVNNELAQTKCGKDNVIVIDEAGVALKTLDNFIVSRTALKNGWKVLNCRNDKCTVQDRYRGGLLSAMLHTFSNDLPTSTIIAGVEGGLSDWDLLGTSKGTSKTLIVTSYSPLSKSDQISYLSSLFNITDQMLNDFYDTLSFFNYSRARWLEIIVKELAVSGSVLNERGITFPKGISDEEKFSNLLRLGKEVKQHIVHSVIEASFQSLSPTQVNKIRNLFLPIEPVEDSKLKYTTMNANEIDYIAEFYYQKAEGSLFLTTKESLVIEGFHSYMKSRAEIEMPTGTRILSLDGGGVLGIVEAMILAEMERLSGKKIYELFDLIIGTSTGGILAITLGIKRYSAKDCVSLFQELATEVFPQNNLFGVNRFQNWDPKPLERFLSKYLGTITFSEVSPYPKVAVTALKRSKGNDPPTDVLFGNYINEKTQINEAARATSAAPTFFPAFEIGGEHYIDGGVGRNNPSWVALREAFHLWPTRDLAILVSVGSGSPPHEKTVALSETLAELLHVATGTEQTHLAVLDYLSYYPRSSRSSNYNRFQPILPEQIPLDDSREEIMQLLQQVTESYINDFSTQERLKDVVSLLLDVEQNRNRIEG